MTEAEYVRTLRDAAVDYIGVPQKTISGRALINSLGRLSGEIGKLTAPTVIDLCDAWLEKHGDGK